MFCSKCGKEIKPGAKFCNGCGAPVNKADTGEEKQEQNADVKIQEPVEVKQNNTAPTSEKKSKKLLFIILGIAAAVIVIIVIAINAMVRDIASDPDTKKLYEEMYGNDNSLKDAYDAAGLTEEEFLEKSKYTKNEYGCYPNVDDYVFVFVDGRLMSIILLEDCGREYTFKGLSVGDTYSGQLEGFSKIEDPLGREDGNSHYYRDETYPNYLLTISCKEDGTIEGIRYTYLYDEDWQAVSEETAELKERYGDSGNENQDAKEGNIQEEYAQEDIYDSIAYIPSGLYETDDGGIQVSVSMYTSDIEGSEIGCCTLSGAGTMYCTMNYLDPQTAEIVSEYGDVYYLKYLDGDLYFSTSYDGGNQLLICKEIYEGG